MMFIAIENAGSAYGFKKKNTANKPNAPQKSRAQEISRASKYEARKKLAAAVEWNPNFDKSEGDFLFAAKMFAEKHNFTCRYGIAGSLRSMFKRVGFECKNTRNLKFDTLIFVGHGNTGIMTTGLGQTPLTKYNDLRDRRHEETLDGLKLDGRMINVQNSETWGGQFRECKDCFGPDRKYDTFHLVFAGCSTGNMSEKSFRYLTVVAGEVLAPILKCKVNAYGTDNEIENAEIEYILTHFDTIKESAVGDKGSISIDTDANVSLDWVKRSP